VSETNNIDDVGMKDWLPRGAQTVDWTDPELKKITRLRLVSDPSFPFWDVSYCWGELKTGERVRVNTPFFQLPKKQMRRHIVEAAKRDGVHAKNLGIFDALSTLT
jgi:hypothetical protein